METLGTISRYLIAGGVVLFIILCLYAGAHDAKALWTAWRNRK